MPLGPAEIPDDFVTPAVAGLTPYEPGKPVEEVQRELGLERVVKLASNEGPFPPFPAALEAMERAARELNRYPDGGAYRLRAKLAETFDVAFEQVTVGSGADGVIDCVSQAFLDAGDEIVCGWPSFPSYVIDAVKLGAVPVRVPLRDGRYDLDALLAAITPRTKIVYLCNPNNPTGTMNTRAEVDAYFERVPEHVLTVLDQAYFEYIDDPEYPDGIESFRGGHRVLAVRTFSKIYGLAGLRVGWGVGSPNVVTAIAKVRRAFDLNSQAQAAAVASLDDRAEVERRRRINAQERVRLVLILERHGFACVGPAVANFVYAESGEDDARPLFDALLREGVIVRPLAGFGAPSAVRVTVGSPEDNAFLDEALGRVRFGTRV
ncbi:MAG TPA: histidinol-phosphate transaminase [Gaiellaceae bacterium]|nr:histidinol-phosphate transaminase [Gaiellaceae bacterium]